MTANQAQHAISLMAEVLGVSVSGFYAFQNRPPSDRQQRDEELAEQIEEVHAQSRGTYGAPRIYEELKEQGREAKEELVNAVVEPALEAAGSLSQTIRDTISGALAGILSRKRRG